MPLIVCLVFGFVSDARAQVVVGEPAPPLQFEAFRTKQQVDLRRLHGNVVIVHFFHGLDASTRREMPRLLEVRNRYARHGVVMLGVSLDNNQAAVVGFADTFDANWSIFYAMRGRLDDYRVAWDVHFGPRVVVVGADGLVTFNGDIARLEDAVVKALGEAGVQGFETMTAEGLAAELAVITKLFDDRKFGDALRRLTAIPASAVDDGSPSAPVYAELVERARQFGSTAFAEADALLEAGDALAALGHLQRIANELADTGFDQQARDRIEELRRDPAVRKALAAAERRDGATKALEMARMLEDRGNVDAAIARYRSIVRLFADLPEAETAKQALERLGAKTDRGPADPSLKKAERLYRLAESYRAAGKAETARAKYEEVIENYPDTFWAKQARKALQELE
ncbi:MAG: tetratricopeptide repeat protein [Planctomycetota bacterium]